MTFSDADYAIIDAGCRRSAAVLAPLLCNRLVLEPGRRLIDVGCGNGHWCEAFRKEGLECVGVDGNVGDHKVDLAQEGSLHDVGMGDVVLCLEVAEHLPLDRAGSFVAELCGLAPIVIFSAAIPNQGGIGHLNEQWPDYWAELFWRQGFAVSGEMRLDIWGDERIENWYRQNLLIAWEKNNVDPPWDCEQFPPASLVHPVLWQHRVR